MSITIKTDAKSLLETYAKLKQIPMEKILRNAGRDFVQAALKVTPLSKLPKSPFARIPLEGRKVRYVHIEHSLTKTYYRRRKVNKKTGQVTYKVADKPKPSRVRHLNKYCMVLRRGWSKASWIGVFRALGVPERVAMRALPQAVQTIANATVSGSGSQAQVHILDPIHFEGLPGTAQRIIDEGYKLATSRIVKDFNRQIQRILK